MPLTLYESMELARLLTHPLHNTPSLTVRQTQVTLVGQNEVGATPSGSASAPDSHGVLTFFLAATDTFRVPQCQRTESNRHQAVNQATTLDH